MKKDYFLKPFKKFVGKDKKREEIEKILGKMTDEQWKHYLLMLHKNKKL